MVMGPQSSLSTAWRVNEHLQELSYTQLWCACCAAACCCLPLRARVRACVCVCVCVWRRACCCAHVTHHLTHTHTARDQDAGGRGPR
jgi:hypothetical protein